jgi:quinolinate synthase
MGQDSTERLREEILRLKRERNAVILAHNYQLGEVQDVADLRGDSLGLSRKAAETDADVIVFCGVHFMAETAAILAPEKTVLLPALEAGCPMADMVDAESLRKRKAELPEAVVVCYVNSSAEVKAESHICCTSANAVEVVNSIPKDREILFVPDQYLGRFTRDRTGRAMHLWPGFCATHVRILPAHIERKKREHPDAEVLAHPECRPEVTALADHVLSTSGILRRAAESDAHTFIVATELGILHRLEKENPAKVFLPATEQAICPNMKLVTLEKVLWALEAMEHKVEVTEAVRVKALASVQRMVEIGR